MGLHGQLIGYANTLRFRIRFVSRLKLFTTSCPHLCVMVSCVHYCIYTCTYLKCLSLHTRELVFPVPRIFMVDVPCVKLYMSATALFLASRRVSKASNNLPHSQF